MTRVARRGLTGYAVNGGSIKYYPSFDREFNTVQCEVINNGNAIGQYQFDPAYPGGKYNRCKFKTQIRSAVTETKIPELDVLLKACGFSEDVSLVYVLDDPKRDGDGTGDTLSCDIRMWTDGLINTITDAVGNAKVVFEAAKIPYIEWEFIGDYSAVDALAAPSLTTANINNPVPWINGSVLVNDGSTSRTGLVVSRIEIDLGNVLDSRPGASGTYGYDPAVINGREPVITAEVEARDLGSTATTMDWEALFAARTSLAWTWTHNPSVTADQQLDWTMNCVQTKYPQLSEKNGKLVYTIEMTFNPAATELQIEVTET